MKNQQDKSKTAGSSKGIIVVSVTVLLAITALYFVLKKAPEEKTLPSAQIFQKDGKLTFQKSDGKSIITINVEIADSEDKREVGLMGRPVMDELQGMLFVFPEEFMARFWMKNTILPLDMIFINKVGEIVTICKNTTPFSDQTYPATAPSLFVVEVNAGFTDRYNIKVGDRINWKRSN